MIKIDTGEKSGTVMVDGAPEDLCLEMLASIKMFYKALERQDIKAARAFRDTLNNNLDDILNMPFDEVEIYKK